MQGSLSCDPGCLHPFPCWKWHCSKVTWLVFSLWFQLPPLGALNATLEELYAQHNALTSLNATMLRHLAALTKLYLTGNEIEHLPPLPGEAWAAT